MDYTKGLPEKMEGFRVFLDEHPELSDKVILIQIAVPSREDVKEYQDLEGEVSKLAGQIIGKHGRSLGKVWIWKCTRLTNITSNSSLDAVALYAPFGLL